MAKITVHGGPSNKNLVQPEETEESLTTDESSEFEGFLDEFVGDSADEPTEETEEVDYSSWNKDDLVDEARNRGLGVSGTKDELVSRLEVDDISKS